MSKRKIYPVKVSGIEYPTVIIDGVQRFIEDPLIVALHLAKMIDLNEIAVLFQTKRPWSKRRYMEFKMSLGYSVCGFAELFPYAKIDNPLWDKEANEEAE
jgi:hypothetical protein